MTTTHTEQNILLFARPYDITAQGFYFESLEEYQEKADKLRNSAGWPVEEFEIQFIDSEALDASLFKALGIHQGNFDAFLDAADSWDKWQKLKVIIAVGECSYAFDLRSGEPDDFDIDLYEMDSLQELAMHFVEEGLFGEIPDNIACYLDYDTIAHDLGLITTK